MVKGTMTKRKLEVGLMIGALLLLFVGIPVAVWAGNSFNGWLGSTYDYTQIENVTAFVDEPITTDDIEAENEFSFGTFGDAESTEETPSWDVTQEWDSVTLVGNESEMSFALNINTTVKELMEGKDFQFRLKLNQTKDLSVRLYAVKSDGIELTRVVMWSSHMSNETQTAYWNWTPTEIMMVSNTLNPAITDEVYLQLVIEGSDDDNELEAGDTIEFQLAWGGPTQVYSFSSWQILTGVSCLVGIVLLFVAAGSTPYWNPLTPKGRGRSAPSGSARGRRRSYRRRK